MNRKDECYLFAEVGIRIFEENRTRGTHERTFFFDNVLISLAYAFRKRFLKVKDQIMIKNAEISPRK